MDAQEYAMSGSETRDQQEAESAAEDAARWTCQVCGVSVDRIFQLGRLRRCGECHRANRAA